MRNNLIMASFCRFISAKVNAGSAAHPVFLQAGVR